MTMSDPWFGPKRFGYGLGPRSWKGWTATAVFVVLILGVTASLPLLVAHHLSPFWAVGGDLVLTIGFLVLVVRKSDRGVLRWRWGDRD